MQRIETVTTIVPVVDADQLHRQLRKLGERDADLQERARLGYRLTHTATISGPHSTTFVDTFTRDDADE